MKTTTYKSESFEQILVTVDGFKTRALLTRFAGDRVWSVRGTCFDVDKFDIQCHDGLKTKFTRKTALELAEKFIRTGRAFL